MSLLLTACGGSSKSDSTLVDNIIAPDVTSNISEAQWLQLSNDLTGDLILPSDSASYGNARLVFNIRYDHIYPQAVIKCSSEEDIITALSFVREYEIVVTPRCGSHSYAGYSTTTGVVIDVTDISHISVDSGTATIGAGARLTDVYDQLTLQGVAIPAGSCLSVGISGLTLGGGFGIVDRAYGLTCDNLISAKVVTGAGELITCDENQHSDLFWALRGGGGGNFGIVSEFTFKTHETSDINIFEASYAFNDFIEVMGKWQLLSQLWPNEMWCQIIPNWSNGTPSLYIRAICLNSLEVAQSYWDNFIASISAIAISNQASTDSYRNVMMGTFSDTVAACHLSAQFNQGRMQRSAFAASSDFFDQILPDIALQTLKNYIESSIENGDYGMLIINTLGGEIDNLSPNETAYVHRDCLFSVEYYAPLNSGVSNEQIDDTQLWQNSFRQLMAPWSTGGAYVNYIDPLIINWQTAYYGSNYEKLQMVKSAYDENSVFNMPQGVSN